MTRQEAISRLEDLKVENEKQRRELELIKSLLTPPKKKAVVKKDFTTHIKRSLSKTPNIYK